MSIPRAALALVLALASAQPALAQNLAGTWWVVAMSGADPLPAEAEASFELAPDRIAGRAFCNRFTATLEREGPEIAVGRAASTRMACPPPLLELERRFLDILAAANQAVIGSDGRLTLRAPDGRLIIAARRG